MKILLLNDFKQYSGAELVCLTLGKGLKDRGHEVFMLTGENIGQLNQAVEKIKPSIIHQHNCARFGHLALRYAQHLPFIQTVHDYWPMCKMRHHFVYKEDRICEVGHVSEHDQCSMFGCPAYLGAIPSPPASVEAYNKFKILMVGVSQCVADRLKFYGYDRTAVVQNGIIPQVVEEEERDLDFVLCSAKNPPQIKGGYIFAEIAKTLPYKHCLVGGEMFEGVVCAGKLPYEKVMELYYTCSLLVVPSVWEEPNGLIIQEAMQFGKPIVAFDVGGIPEYVKNYTVPLRDREAMREVIVTLMENKEIRREAGRENKEAFLNNFTMDHMVQKYITLYKEAMKEKGMEWEDERT